MKKDRLLLKTIKGHKKFLKSKRRSRKLRLRRLGYYRHQLHVKRKAKAEGKSYNTSAKSPFSKGKRLAHKPAYPVNIKYLSTILDPFSKKQYNQKDGHLYIPKCFSLLENYEESFDFLKRLFQLLHKNKLNEIILDYDRCERIDVDASICMDVILMEFISHIKHCRKLGYRDILKTIAPRNFGKDNIKKVLFSIGAYRNISGLKINYPDVIDLPMIVNDHDHPQVWSKSEVDLTTIVEYIKECLKRLNRQLTADAENEFYKVIGEVMSNSLEHGTMKHSFAIGFFQETHNEEEHFGVFNFSIFNFGDTIYQTFKKEECPNKRAVQQMTDLSEDYTKKGWFKKATFEEETLWTLYALQEGVTSKEKKRGNGSIQYIENFFKLKGDMSKDNISRLVIISGNTRILFDGTYNIVPKQHKEGDKRKYKMITFNSSGNISDEPDKKFVSFAPHFFPGTMISARILIKFDNTNEQPHGTPSV
jgi:hypothetical protein